MSIGHVLHDHKVLYMQLFIHEKGVGMKQNNKDELGIYKSSMTALIMTMILELPLVTFVWCFNYYVYFIAVNDIPITDNNQMILRSITLYILCPFVSLLSLVLAYLIISNLKKYKLYVRSIKAIIKSPPDDYKAAFRQLDDIQVIELHDILRNQKDTDAFKFICEEAIERKMFEASELADGKSPFTLPKALNAKKGGHVHASKSFLLLIPWNPNFSVKVIRCSGIKSMALVIRRDFNNFMKGEMIELKYMKNNKIKKLILNTNYTTEYLNLFKSVGVAFQEKKLNYRDRKRF